MIGFVGSVTLRQSRFVASRCGLAGPAARTLSVARMSLGVGDKLPMDAPLNVNGEDTTVKDLFAGKKVVVCSLPGALTPTCTSTQGPGFVANYDNFKSLGVDDVMVLCVNDFHVMKAFGKQLEAGDKVKMVADGGAAFSKATGLYEDTGNFGGVRSMRYAMLVDDGTIKALNIDAIDATPEQLDNSTAEHLLEEMEAMK